MLAMAGPTHGPNIPMVNTLPTDPRSHGRAHLGLPPMTTTEEKRPPPRDDQPPLERRLERALLLLAYLIELDGDVHVPMYERIEGELRVMQKRRTTRARARQLLADYANAIGDPAKPRAATADADLFQIECVRPSEFS